MTTWKKGLILVWLLAGALIPPVLGDHLLEYRQTNGVVIPDDGYDYTVSKNDLTSETILSVSVLDVGLTDRSIEQQLFTEITMGESGYTNDPGLPILPFIGLYVRIGDNVEVAVEVTPLTTAEYPLPHPVMPSQGLDREDITKINYFNTAWYDSGDRYPQTLVTVEEPQILRDVRVVLIRFYPFVYQPQTQTLEIIEEAELRIRPIGPGVTNVLKEPQPITGSWAALYRAVVANWDRAWEDRDHNPEHYLLVLPDNMEARYEGFIGWKEEQGYDVDVLRLSQLGSNPTASQLKTTLQNIYNSTNRPAYIIIGGGYSNTPTTSFSGYLDDGYFSFFAGNDYLPDVYLGRIPAATPAETTVMLDKILWYEQTPNPPTQAFYYKALMSCSGLYPSQQRTKEQTRDRLTSVLGYEVVHEEYNWDDQSHAQITSWINEGVSIVNYRGEGWWDGWHPAHAYSFSYSNVLQFANYNQIPIVTSIGCGVAMYSHYQSGDTCFGLTWMLLGSPSARKGAVCFMGPTGNTHTTYNNWLDRGLYRGVCYHDLTRTSVAFVYGKLYMIEHVANPSQSTLELQVREFVHFGNPDLEFRTDPPQSALIDVAFPVDSQNPAVLVRYPNHKPVPGAMVSVHSGSVYKVGYADEDGGAEFALPSGHTDTLNCIVTGYNLRHTTAQVELFIPTTADLIITEIKPDRQTTGFSGDIIELYNRGTVPVDLKDWTVSDLDLFDPPFTRTSALLAPGAIAVIEFIGPLGYEAIETTPYGVSIRSIEVVDFSSLEDQAVLRDPRGVIVDSLAWHNGTGVGSTNDALDLSRLTPLTSPVGVTVEGWWEGPDEVTREAYETYTIDWTQFMGIGGPGSIQRIYSEAVATRMITSRNSPADYEVLEQTTFGAWGPETLTIETAR